MNVMLISKNIMTYMSTKEKSILQFLLMLFILKQDLDQYCLMQF